MGKDCEDRPRDRHSKSEFHGSVGSNKRGGSPFAESLGLFQSHPMNHPRLMTLLLATLVSPVGASAEVDFSREILPVLSDNCFQCHGPDPKSRKGELRLDDEADAKRDRGGHAVVVAGKSGESELIKRLLTHDPDDLMPPPELGKKIPADVIVRIRRWIDEGAQWGVHWALTPIERPDLAVAAGHPIDGYISTRLVKEGLAPQPRASRETLIRRLHQDLTGLPPTPAEVDGFLADKRPDAWRRLVRRVMGKAAFGERMAWD